jgi:sec-independent protein translocase protein TatA
MPIGIPELLVLLVIVLVIFGPKRLPMLGRQLGGGLREFKDSITSKSKDEEQDVAGLPSSPETDPLNPTPDTTRTAAGERDETVTRPGQ